MTKKTTGVYIKLHHIYLSIINNNLLCLYNTYLLYPNRMQRIKRNYLLHNKISTKMHYT